MREQRSSAPQATPAPASTATTARRHGRARGSSVVIVSRSERARAFRDARRNTALVRTARIAFPVIALVIAAGYVWQFQSGVAREVAHDARSGLSIGTPTAISLESMAMSNPSYQGYTSDGGRYVVRAEKALTALSGNDPIRLETITGTLDQPDGTKTDFTATRGSYQSKTGLIDLAEGITIRSSSGLTADLSTATISAKEGKVVSSEPVTVTLPSARVTGRTMVLHHKARTVAFDEGVEARFTPPQRKAPEPAPAAAPPATSPLSFGTDDPIDITSHTLDIDDVAHRAVFATNVRATQADAVLTTDKLEITYKKARETAVSAGSVLSAAGDAGRLERIVATGDVTITRAGDVVTSPVASFDPAAQTTELTGGVTITRATSRITSAAASFDARASVGVLTGDVVLTDGPERTAKGDRLAVDQAAQVAELTGTVEVMQGENRLTGRLLQVDRKAGTLALSAPAEPGRPAGRIAAHFVQPGKTAAPPPRSGDDAGGWSFRTDPNAPVDIASDTLFVDDRTSKATFAGNVVANQAEFRLSAPELVATYTGRAGLGDLATLDPTAEPQRSAGRTPAARLKHIRASSGDRRQVVVESGQTQRATGDVANFDMASNTVTLDGNVTLTHGRQQVRGSRLVIDVTTGVARIEANSATAPVPSAAGTASPPPAAGGSLNCPPGQTCARFFIDDAKKARREFERRSRGSEPRSSLPIPSAATGWSTEARPVN